MLAAQPGDVVGDRPPDRRVGARLVEQVEHVLPARHVALAAEVAVVLVQPAPTRIQLDVGGEEDDRPADERVVVGDRGVVGDERVDCGEHGVHVGHTIDGQQPDARRAGRSVGVVAESERVGAHEQHRVVALEPGGDRLPLVGRGDAGVGGAVTPGGGVEHESCARGQPFDRLAQSREGRGPTVGGVAGQQHVVARVARDDDAAAGHAEGALDARGDELGRDREQADPAPGEAIRPCEESAHEAMVRQERHLERRGRVQVQLLRAGCRATAARRTRPACRSGSRRRSRG